MKHYTISIAGGGIAGLTTAIALKRIGLEAQVFESSDLLTPVGAGLGLGINALRAFKHLGIYSEVAQHGQFLPSFTIYDQNGHLITKTNFDQCGEPTNLSIHRADLQDVLLAKLDPDTIHTNKRILDLEQTDMGIRIRFDNGSTHFTNYLIASDGIHSAIRRKLVPKAIPRYAGYTCWRAVIDNTLIPIKESSETWGTKGRFGIVPLAGNRLYWFACINRKVGDTGFEGYTISDLKNRFEKYHYPIFEIISSTQNEQLIHHDIHDLSPLRKFAYDRILLIGDAAHATTPNMGQGACQAIEDAVILSNCLKIDADPEKAFKHFEGKRQKRTKWVINTSRNIGRIAQFENPWLINVRNKSLSMLPESISKIQLNKISQVDF